ncbi:hypothetical protein [Sporolactobacillus shoreae]|uniref:hypothetical protein n=1 Tax=Sporolactobacillus shoreae TaxID=1465501 RepID=UPI001432F6FB|nr:hypothetical protein [Sporolactobacillus shoreae]
MSDQLQKTWKGHTAGISARNPVFAEKAGRNKNQENPDECAATEKRAPLFSSM